MNGFPAKTCTAFQGSRLLASGQVADVVLAIKDATEVGGAEPILVFDDSTGRDVDFDLRGTRADVVSRLGQPPAAEVKPDAGDAPRGRGRPKLGVVGREVTLLPRQWDWLAAQPGGASVTLRRLVDDARRSGTARQKKRAAQEAAYHFMAAMAGNLPGFEEATRALFAEDQPKFDREIADWPADVRAHARRLASGDDDPVPNRAEGRRRDGS